VKKIIALLMCLAPMLIAVMPLHGQAYTTNQRSKAIHVVYDDSGSMIEDDTKVPAVPVDRWGQAKYAMEVFAVMLEEQDTMAVYYMSDFDALARGNVNAPPRITISGSQPAETRVSTIHDTVTRAEATPYDAVAKAYADLRTANADDKWLVVLTDGEFNRLGGVRRDPAEIDVNGFFSQYVNESGARIILLSMGDVAPTIRANPGRGIYFEQAKNSNEILGKITSICNMIFNRNKLNFTNESRLEFDFDIPMIELLVFAQGDDVRINGIRGDNQYSSSEAPVNVRYSEVATTNPEYRNVIVSRNLSGAVATFRPFPNIPKGSYRLDVTGARTVEVYYKPDVDVVIKLLQGNREIRRQDIYEGSYQIQYGIVEDGKFIESDLLGTVVYDATAVNDGQSFTIKSGDTVNLKVGELRVNVKARFLEINTAEPPIFTRSVVTKPPLIDRIRDWIKRYWFIFWPLAALLAGLLLYWLLWGRKKRFPKYMTANKPTIKVEKDGSPAGEKHGSFKVKKRWSPIVAEEGIIVAAADGKTLPSLKVRALGRKSERMELTNPEDFSEKKLGGVEFYINDQKLVEGSTRKKEMSCTASIKSIYYSAGIMETHTCTFTRRKSRKKDKK
jgi:hypothetical protein